MISTMKMEDRILSVVASTCYVFALTACGVCHLRSGDAVSDGIRQPWTRLISDGFAVLSELCGARTSERALGQ